MPSPRISKELKGEIYFVSLTVQKWYYIFDRHERWEILLKALQYYQKNNDLILYAWVFMLKFKPRRKANSSGPLQGSPFFACAYVIVVFVSIC